jgi:transcriptional regulator with XRE-family HTH domain
MIDYDIVLRLIKERVDSRGKPWNQAKLAGELEMSEAWVSRILSGDIELSVKMLLAIAEKLDISPAILFPMKKKMASGEKVAITFEDYLRDIVREEFKLLMDLIDIKKK